MGTFRANEISPARVDTGGAERPITIYHTLWYISTCLYGFAPTTTVR